jgi:hypothetical protein
MKRTTHLHDFSTPCALGVKREDSGESFTHLSLPLTNIGDIT